MDKLNSTSMSGMAADENPKKLLAAPRHTWTLFGIVMILLVAGVLNSSNKHCASQVAYSSQMLKTKLVIIAVLWVLGLFNL